MFYQYLRNFIVISLLSLSTANASQQCNSAKMPFIKNIGQAPKHVAFYLQTPSADVYFNQKSEISYSFKMAGSKQSFVIKETLLNAKPKLSPLNQQKTKINNLKGKNKSHKNIPSYSELSLGSPWKGIEMKVSTRPGNIEKLFTLKPQADVSLIKIELKGQKNLSKNKKGELKIETTLGDFAFTQPVAWQTINEKRVAVEVSYVVAENSYGFELGAYDKRHKVIIDPLIASTYVGGNGQEIIGEKYINDNGEIIIAGSSSSDNFPTVTGVFSEQNFGGFDFIALKFNSTMCELLAMTYFGGSGTDQARAIAFDAVGNIYFAGDTSSVDFPLPDLPYQPFQEENNPNGSIFIASLSADFTQVLGATHIGGDIVDLVRDIEISPNGNVYVSGFTNSSNYPFTVGAFESTGAGAIISAFNPDLSQLLYSTKLGGGDNSAIVFDADGSLFIATNKFSTSEYTTTPGVYNPAPDGGSGVPNNYVAHMSEDLSTLIAATFISRGASIYGILIAGDELLLSTQESNINITDIFKMDKDLTLITANISLEIAAGAVSYLVEDDNNILVLGTGGPAGLSGVVNPDNSGYHGGPSDFILARINATLTEITSFLFIGGASQEFAPGNIIKDSAGNIIVSGLTRSNDVITSPFAHGQSFGGGTNDFLVQIITRDFNETDLKADLIFCNGFESPVGCSCTL